MGGAGRRVALGPGWALAAGVGGHQPHRSLGAGEEAGMMAASGAQALAGDERRREMAVPSDGRAPPPGTGAVESSRHPPSDDLRTITVIVTAIVVIPSVINRKFI